MKHYSDDSKKLIKNVVSLVVSALLLAAATVAWFASSSEAGVEGISATVDAPKVVNYARMTPDPSFLDFDVTNKENNQSTNASTLTDALAIRTRPSTYTDVTAYLLDSEPENEQDTDYRTWIASGSEVTTGDHPAVVDSKYQCPMVPGEYAAFKISYSGDSRTNTLSFSNIAYSTAMTSAQAETEGWDDYDADDIKEAAYKSIYVYSFVRTTTPAAQQGGEPTVVTSTPTKQTLYDLAYRNNAYQTSADVVSNSAASGTAVEVYYVIGMPANETTTLENNGPTLHDIIRHAGATITIGLAEVSSGSSGGSGS